MTLGGKLVSLFPPLLLTSILVSCIWWLLEPTWYQPLILVGIVYVVPLFFFRVHNLFFPLKEGVFDITSRKYNVWWASYQFQFIYIANPWLESWMHMMPGLYSIWLRLWGSKIGKGIVWTPKMELVDRTLMEVGDQVVFGHLCGFSCHAISPVDGKMSLIIKKIKLGKGCFIGAEAKFGPGVTVEAGKLIKAQSSHFWRGEYKK